LVVVGALQNGFAKNFVFKGEFADEITSGVKAFHSF